MREGEPDTPRGNITVADALAELGISIRHDWKAS
jgi:sulfur carrier protein ThiS